MTRRRSLARRSAVEWTVRALIAVAVAALGYGSVAYTLGFAMKGNPALAHDLAATDGRITARAAFATLTAQPTQANRGEARRLARLAVEQDPTAVRAFVTLGLDAQVRGDMPRARRLFAYAQALSRRELQTQLWAIEDAVARDDIPGALRQYDIALRTSRTAPDLLFPVLAKAIADPPIRTALIETLAAKPAWSAAFVDYVVGNGPGARANAAFFQGLRRGGVPVTEEASAMTINALIAGGMLNDAWSYYAGLRPGADRRVSRDPHFTAKVDYPAPFDWLPVNDSNVTASIRRDDEGGVFEFSTPSGVGGPLLSQLQMLPPGTYRLEGRGTGPDPQGESYLYWKLSCGDGRELGRVDLRGSTQAGERFSGSFTVPEACAVQTLSLMAPASTSASGLAGQITEVTLRPEE